MHRSTRYFYCTLAVFAANFFVPLPVQSADHNSLRIKLAEATQLAMADNRDDARNLFKKIASEYPDSPEAYNNLAVLAAYSEDWKGAISLLEQALATNKSLQTSYRNLNLIYRYKAALAYRAALPEQNGGSLLLPDLTMLTSPSNGADDSAVARAGAESTGDTALTPEWSVDEKSVQTEVVAALQQWVAAWSAQDIDAYLSSYVPDYAPDTGIAHANWRKLRRQRLLKPSFIEVSVFDEKIEVLSAQSAMIIFTQEYRTASFQDRVRKLMLMNRSDDGWAISREHTLQ